MRLKKYLVWVLFVLGTLGASAQTGVQYEMTVAQDDSGDFTTIQAAVDAIKAFPDKRITIYIKNGVYLEKIIIPSWNNQLSLIGEDPEKTIVRWDDSFNKINRGRNSTFFTYTLKVEADDFYAENLTIENAAGPVGQAVALHVEGDRVVFKNCRITGNQDTLYVNGENSRQYFKACIISGTTDFIFGSATAVFEDCTIISKKDSYITAASTVEGKVFGLVFIHCNLQAAEGVGQVYLGRPWRPFAKTVFIECRLGKHIRAEGWKEWNNADDKSTTYYAEYNNSGEGALTKDRVAWSHRLDDAEAEKYSAKNILGDWIDNY